MNYAKDKGLGDFKQDIDKELEYALWQYFVDHGRVQPNGYLGVLFYVKDVNDFLRRVHARYTRDFKRYDALEVKHKQDVAAYLFKKQQKDWIGNRCRSIEKCGSWKDRLALKAYYWLRNYLFFSHDKRN